MRFWLLRDDAADADDSDSDAEEEEEEEEALLLLPADEAPQKAVAA